MVLNGAGHSVIAGLGSDGPWALYWLSWGQGIGEGRPNSTKRTQPLRRWLRLTHTHTRTHTHTHSLLPPGSGSARCVEGAVRHCRYVACDSGYPAFAPLLREGKACGCQR